MKQYKNFTFRIVIVLSFLILYFNETKATCNPTSDRAALVDFYNATGGDNWENPWNLSLSMNDWHGVTLNTANGCVEELSLNNNNLTGNLIDIDLPELKLFNCAANQLTGNIPNFSNLPNLEAFACQGNKLTGNIPDFLNLTNLKTFICIENQLTGKIPNFTNNTKLEIIWCFYNQLTGLIPDFTDTCPNLESLTIIGNQFSFEDIVPSLSNNETLCSENGSGITGYYNYSSQDSIYADTTIFAIEDLPFTVDLLIDEDMSENQYSWFKDGIPYGNPIIGNNNLGFLSISPADEGVYTCEITNPLAPNLTLLAVYQM